MPKPEVRRPDDRHASSPPRRSPTPDASKNWLWPPLVHLQQARLAAALIEPGIEQLAGLDLAGLGAALRDDQVEAVVRAHVAADRHARRRARGYRRRRRAAGAPGGARGDIEARCRRGPGCAAAYRRPRSGCGAARARRSTRSTLEPQIEAGAEGERIERARLRAVGAAAERQLHPRAGLELAERHHAGDHARRPPAPRPAPTPARSSTRAKPSPWPIVAVRSMRRPLGRVDERLDRVGRRHPPAGIGAERERREAERARLLPLRLRAARAGAAPGSGAKPGAVAIARAAQRGAGGEAAPPFARCRCARRDRRRDRDRRAARASRRARRRRAARGIDRQRLAEARASAAPPPPADRPCRTRLVAQIQRPQPPGMSPARRARGRAPGLCSGGG